MEGRSQTSARGSHPPNSQPTLSHPHSLSSPQNRRMMSWSPPGKRSKLPSNAPKTQAPHANANKSCEMVSCSKSSNYGGSISLGDAMDILFPSASLPDGFSNRHNFHSKSTNNKTGHTLNNSFASGVSLGESSSSCGPRISSSQPVKRKVLQMNVPQCLNHAATQEGAQPLTNPQRLTQQPYHDVNGGLYPREQRTKQDTSHMSRGNMSGSSYKRGLSQASSCSPLKQTQINNFFAPSPKKNTPASTSSSQNFRKGTQYNLGISPQKNVATTSSYSGRICSTGNSKYQHKLPNSTLVTCQPDISDQELLAATCTSSSGSLDNQPSHLQDTSSARSKNHNWFNPGKLPQKPMMGTGQQQCSSKVSHSLQKPISNLEVKSGKRNAAAFGSQVQAKGMYNSNKSVNTNRTAIPRCTPRSSSQDQSSPQTAQFKTKLDAIKAAHQTYHDKFCEVLKAFEEDDVSVEEFDKAIQAVQNPVSSQPPNNCSADVVKEFEDDNSITADEFDDILRASQNSVNSQGNPSQPDFHCTPSENQNKVKIHSETPSLAELAFQQDDSITVEEFDEALKSSQKSVGSFSEDKPECVKEDDCILADEYLEYLGASPDITNCFDKDMPGPSNRGMHPKLSGNKHASSQGGPSPSKAPCTFGLLGEDIPLSPDNVPVDYFGMLPDEVTENILGQLPVLDLLLSAATVCKKWNAMISKERFVPWKKQYFKLKKSRGMEESIKVGDMVNETGQPNQGSCLIQLIRFMKSTFRTVDKTAAKSLKLHPKYTAAVEVIKAKAEDVIANQEPHPWSVVAAIIILSETASEVCKIIDVLLRGGSPVNRMEVSECFYCIATLLLVFQKDFNITRGLHFRVFHALFKLENSETSNNEELSETARRSGKGQQSLLRYGQRSGICLTPEQMRIINHDLKPEDTIKIIAFAGTGKTTTLIRFAQLRPDLNFLYIAFNKTVQQHAEKMFPSNVECRTTHSLAYRAVGYKFRQKMCVSFKPYYIEPLLPHVDPKVMHPMTLAKHVVTTICFFMSTADPYITTAHTPRQDFAHRPPRSLDHNQRMIIANAAERVFEKLCDQHNDEARITHDVYLKIYQMEHPKLEGYDCLLIDEAQDLTAAQQSILLNQSCAKILVGDPHQQIYSFRGASNAMHAVQASRIYRLTQSFRFGPEIAYVANCLLESLKGQTKNTVIGTGPTGSVYGESVGQVATITRCNSVLFTEAVKKVEANANVKIEFAGGIAGYGFDKILDIYYLSLPPAQRAGFRIKDKFIGRFKSLSTLNEYAISSDDLELQQRIALVRQYHNRIPDLIKKIKKSSVRTNGDVVLTNAHKSKGLEFDTVQLTDDFIQDIVDAAGNRVSEDEKNLLYVAVTRAKKRLLLNYTLLKFLKRVGENFEYPVLAKEVREKEGPPRCQQCGHVEVNQSQVLLLRRQAIKLVHSLQHRNVEGGYVCPGCVTAKGFEGLFGKTVVNVPVILLDNDLDSDDEIPFILMV